MAATEGIRSSFSTQLIPRSPKLRIYEMEDLRAQTNFKVIEQMSDREQHDWAHFGKLRREWDRQFEDPDDVYLKAEQREERTPKAGIAASAGVIPHEAIAAEETSLDAEQRRRKGAAGKPGDRGPYERVKYIH